jgi:hypothetical protein
MSGLQIDKIDICDCCTKDGKVIFIGQVKQSDGPERTVSLCKDCFQEECLCAICGKKTIYSSYERHLLKNHTIDQMARQLLNERIYSNLF